MIWFTSWKFERSVKKILSFAISANEPPAASHTAFKLSKENSDLRLENRKLKDKIVQLESEDVKMVSQQKINYEVIITEMEEKMRELMEKVDSIQTDDVLLQKLEYWKEKAKQETARIENLEKQIIAHGDTNFMSKIFG